MLEIDAGRPRPVSADGVERLADLRRRTGIIDQAELAELWSALAPARTVEMLGAWRGGLFDTGHPHNRRTGSNPWHGKHFVSLDTAWPDVCEDPSGVLYTAGSPGSLWMVEFRGEVTASLIYDDQPVLDHFKRVDDRTALGVMNREVDRSSDTWLYFWLEREEVPLLG